MCHQIIILKLPNNSNKVYHPLFTLLHFCCVTKAKHPAPTGATEIGAESGASEKSCCVRHTDQRYLFWVQLGYFFSEGENPVVERSNYLIYTVKAMCRQQKYWKADYIKSLSWQSSDGLGTTYNYVVDSESVKKNNLVSVAQANQIPVTNHPQQLVYLREYLPYAYFSGSCLSCSSPPCEHIPSCECASRRWGNSSAHMTTSWSVLSVKEVENINCWL